MLFKLKTWTPRWQQHKKNAQPIKKRNSSLHMHILRCRCIVFFFLFFYFFVPFVWAWFTVSILKTSQYSIFHKIHHHNLHYTLQFTLEHSRIFHTLIRIFCSFLILWFRSVESSLFNIFNSLNSQPGSYSLWIFLSDFFHFSCAFPISLIFVSDASLINSTVFSYQKWIFSSSYAFFALCLCTRNIFDFNVLKLKIFDDQSSVDARF